MRLRLALRLGGLLALAALAGGAVALIAWDRGQAPENELLLPREGPAIPGVDARVTLTPRVVAFGDTVRAHVDVTLDRTRVDPETVRVTTDFAPWRSATRPVVTRRDGKTSTHVRTTYVLRCLASVCLPARQALKVDFQPATITFDPVRPGAPAGKRTLAWPQLTIHTRLAPEAPPTSGAGQPGRFRNAYEFPWRAELVSLPPPSYRVDPDVARFPLFAAAGLLGLLGLALAYLGRPRRRPQPVAVVEEAPPPPPPTPLEQALELLRAPAANGAAERRRALELVAEELAGRGSGELAVAARGLAWSPDPPPLERTRPIAEQALPVLRPHEEEAAEAEEPGA